MSEGLTMPECVAHTLVLVAGLVVLAVGGEFLVRGAVRLARALGVSALVVGLTVVAFGTSAPEAAVTIFAASRGTAEAASLAIGNVVGSNIANILLILGFAAAIGPLAVSRRLIRFDGPIMILSAALFMALAWLTGRIDRIAGGVFVAGLIAYTAFTYYQARKNPPPANEHDEPLKGLGQHWWYNLILVAIGVGTLVGGAALIVQGASGLARAIGISDHVIGLTIVALGTSLPELATAAVAARHKQPDIAIGNIVGSNIFNVLFVTGLAALTHPLAVPEAIVCFDGPLMLAICIVFYPIVWTGQKVTRWEGLVLLAMYVSYLTWTGVQATARGNVGT